MAGRPADVGSVRAVTDVTAMAISGRRIEDDSEHGYWIGLLTRALADRFLEKEREIESLEKRLSSHDRRRR